MYTHKDNVAQFRGESDTGHCTQIEQEDSFEALFNKVFSDRTVWFFNRSGVSDKFSIGGDENGYHRIVLQKKYAVTHSAPCTVECQAYVDGLLEQPWNREASEAVDLWIWTSEAPFEQLALAVLRGGVA